MRQTIMIMVLVVLAAGAAMAADAPANGVVNLNTASAEQLQLLPRVGPSIAGRIVEFRQQNGPFDSVDELVAVRGIGERSLEGLRPYLAVDGDTTLTEKVRLPRTTGEATAS